VGCRRPGRGPAAILECMAKRQRSRSAQAPEDWTLVDEAQLAPRQNSGQIAKQLLEAKGLGGVPERDVKIDLICGRNADLDSWVRVWVRTTPSPVPDRKPRLP
jgi:hypothetical protein